MNIFIYINNKGEYINLNRNISSDKDKMKIFYLFNQNNISNFLCK